jgi:hypothetical protein
MKYLFTFGFIILFSFSYAQETVLEEYPLSETASTWGPGRENYVHLYAGYGMFADQAAGSAVQIHQLKSTEYRFGYRYKRRILKFWELGFDLSFANNSYSIVQDTLKRLPDNITHNKQRISLSTFNFEVFERMVFGKRGDIMGTYLDFGVYGSILAGSQIKSLDKYNESDPFYAKKRITMDKKLEFTELYNYGVSVRLGRNKTALFAKYRLTDIFKSSYTSLTELPRITVGIEFELDY